MTDHFTLLHEAVRVVVALCWLVLGSALLFYAAMLGMLRANCLAVSRPAALLPALVVYGIGAAVRIRSEEKLLRDTFGREFAAYARRVPAVFPRLDQ